MLTVPTDRPIVSSLLEADFYKFTMGQFVWNNYQDVNVTGALRCRTKGVRLGEIIDLGQLREELDHIRTLRFNNSQLHYLRGTNEYGNRMFHEPYLEFLRAMSLPEYNLEKVGPDIRLEFGGPWSTQKYQETLGLSIVDELYTRALMKPLSRFERETVMARACVRLAEKIKILRGYPDIFFSDFGTRRRAFAEWQTYVNEVLCAELPSQFLGSSNTDLAMRFGTVPMGTSAHELQMVVAGLRQGQKDWLKVSQQEVVEGWWQQYGYGLSIFLPDTYGSEFFFDNLTPQELSKWKGARWDSGDPFVFGDKLIARYEKHGIDPKTKLIVFSDGLDIAAIVKLHTYFNGRIKTSYGWGTNLTNDLWDNAWHNGLWYGPLSLVIKPATANGRGLVKLSDNPEKATGRPEDIERYMQAVGYDRNTKHVACVY
jgi:nicotinate phosphoribosyltransferase